MGLFDHPKPNDIKNWVCVYESGIEYEVEMVKNYFSNLKIPSNILSKRDTAYSLYIGDMALIYLYVPQEFEKKALSALEHLNKDLESSDDEDGVDS